MFKLTIFKQNKFQFFSLSDFTTQLIRVAHCLMKERKKKQIKIKTVLKIMKQNWKTAKKIQNAIKITEKKNTITINDHSEKIKLFLKFTKLLKSEISFSISKFFSKIFSTLISKLISIFSTLLKNRERNFLKRLSANVFFRSMSFNSIKK